MKRSHPMALALLIILSITARAQSFDVKTHTLKNGMKILVQEDHSIPNATMYIFYRIGSRNERPGTTGISHFFEHSQMKTINGRANTLGAFEVFFGDYNKLFSAAGDYGKVTKEDVRRVAQKYFGEKNRTVATLVPEVESVEQKKDGSER